MNDIKTLIKYICLLILIGIFSYWLLNWTQPSLLEGMGNSGPRCPNLLIQKGSDYFLYNTNLAEVPGVNPIQFSSLEEYVEFLDWQKSQGIICPVLYLQNSYDAQGNRVYKVRPSCTEPQGGLPPTTPVALPTKLVDASRNDPPYNKGNYPGFDPSSYYVGTTTPLDAMNNTSGYPYVSDSAMDTNWGGADYTQALVEAGYYGDNEVSINIP
jgi:hypothetical protein